MSKEIDRPLGQAGQVRRSPSGRTFFRVFPLLVGLGAVAMVGASAFVAMRDPELRDPSLVAVATPVLPETSQASAAIPTPAKAEEPTTVGSIERQVAPNGAAIIKLRPDPSGDAAAKGVVIIRDPSSVGQDLRIAHLPDRSMLEQSDTGPLPVVSADGRRPFDVYARKWSGARGARVAIVIGGFGLSQTGTQAAIEKLPAEVTLGFSPQGNSLGRWMQAARRKGHELVMQVPLEPFDYPKVDPGRNTLTVAAGREENSRSLHAALGRTTNYTGVMNYMGARFVTDPAAMAGLMEELGQRGLMYVDDGTSALSLAPDLALQNKVPFATADTTIDVERDRGSILKKLDQLERTARAKGFAIGTGSAFDGTVDAVSSWVVEARKRGIEVVPISAVAEDPGRG